MSKITNRLTCNMLDGMQGLLLNTVVAYFKGLVSLDQKLGASLETGHVDLLCSAIASKQRDGIRLDDRLPETFDREPDPATSSQHY